MNYKPTLYIVSTPIGNLEDISYRAVKVLSSVDLILCEDTRRTKILLDRYGIKKPLKSYYSFIEEKRVEEIIPYLKEGHCVALVSDSGTPGISDPGFLIINECIKNNINVTSIPGPTAFISAAVCSGLPLNKILFLGFIPKKEIKIKKTFEDLLNLKDTTIIFYESPKRIKKTINILKTIFPENTKCVVAKELTKIYENFLRGTIKEISQILNSAEVKGEYVVLIYNS